jgi:hypothetical protein
MCQLAVMGGMILFFPNVKVEMYVYNPAVSNGTLQLGQCGVTHPVKFTMAIPALAVSVAAAAFTSSTYNLIENNEFPTGDYAPPEMEKLAVWQALFWFVVAMFHAVCVFAITTPVDVFAGSACTYLMVNFLQRLCAPAPEQPHLSHASLNVVGFLAGFILTFYSVPISVYSNRIAVGFVLGLLDYLLWIGHTWDKEPKMNTVTTCRMVWVCCSSVVLAGLYGAWHDSLLNPHSHPD